MKRDEWMDSHSEQNDSVEKVAERSRLYPIAFIDLDGGFRSLMSRAYATGTCPNRCRSGSSVW